MKKFKNYQITITIFIVCLIYNIVSFLRTCSWNMDSIIISSIIIISSFIATIIFNNNDTVP